MCFKSNARRRILSKIYYLSYGKRFIYIKVKDLKRNKLSFDILNKKGCIKVEVFDSNNSVTYTLDNPETNVYEVSLEVGQKYKIVITTKAAVGHYYVYF